MAGKTEKTREVLFSPRMYKLVSVTASHPKMYFKRKNFINIY